MITPTTHPIVYLIDADMAFRQQTAEQLAKAGFDVRSFSSAAPFLEQLNSIDSGCVVLDLYTPGVSGLRMLEQLVAKMPWLPVIMTSSHCDVDAAVRSMKSGAFDFFQKPIACSQLVDRLHQAISQGRSAQSDCTQCQSVMTRVNTLTRREREVMDRLFEGMANKQIAAALKLSQRTVEVHRSHIMQKMKAGSIAELISQYSKLDLLHRCPSRGSMMNPAACA
ncbi:response regulator transcription factor [Planctomycetales bacterium ZRK34]|nr:response regulator transcription factor [Planctomycetales bacterium ZRK34]